VSVKTLTIDGKMLTGVAGESVFSVAWHNEIRIPRLCHLGGVPDVGACRLCLVEVEGRSKLSASCMTEIEEGMVVRTDTEQLREYRKLLLELLFAEGNHVCAVCVSNGNCELQDLATELGIDHVRVPYRHQKRAVDLSHERFGLDLNRCIACTRCVRTCDDVEGAHVWDMAGRGEKLHLVADLGEPWGESKNCTSCGKCVQVCPTGALFTKGVGIGEMKKDRSFLKYIVYGRERHQWVKKP
jgi:bidirectional [NiFe] hydrogenase diaphorase subunit